MFGATPNGGKARGAAPAGAARRGLLDNYDDAEGYYNFQARCLGCLCRLEGARVSCSILGGLAVLAAVLCSERCSTRLPACLPCISDSTELASPSQGVVVECRPASVSDGTGRGNKIN